MIEMHAAAKAYVRFVMAELKLSASGLAKGAKLAPTTLTRALNDPSHTFALSTSTIEKIAKFSGINPAPFFDAKDFVQMSMAPYERPDFYDESWGIGANPTVDENVKEGHLTIIIGTAAAGVWKDPELTQLENGEFLWATLPNSRKVDVFGVRMGDASANRYIQPEEFALCARVTAELPLYHGNLVVVERWRPDAPLMELSIRRLIIPESGDAYLRMESHDQKFSERLPYPGLVNTEHKKVIGTVAWAMRSIHDPVLDEEARIQGLRKRGYID